MKSWVRNLRNLVKGHYFDAYNIISNMKISTIIFLTQYIPCLSCCQMEFEKFHGMTRNTVFAKNTKKEVAIMTLAVSRTFRRPFWVTPFGMEGWRDLFSDRLWPELLGEKDEGLSPNVDFSEKDGKYFLTAELPGLKKDDISISIEDGYITVSGKKETNKEEEGTNYYLKETRSGSFRSWNNVRCNES